MLLAVDIGNTSIKLGWFSAGQRGWPQAEGTLVLATQQPESWQLDRLPPQPAAWFVGSVHREAETHLASWVARQRPKDRYRRLEYGDLPLVIDVDAPERVGADRLLGAVAANVRRERARAAIVIDAGTAVTVDLVAADGSFQGGVIWPGWGMMAQSLAGKTDALPLLTEPLSAEPPAIVGKSTEKAMKSGIYWGNVGALREFIAQMRRQLPDEPQIFVTGGDAQRLVREACPMATHVEDLVLAGTVITARTLAP